MSEIVLKNLNQPFTEEEFRKLKEKKGDQTWREFILSTLTEKRYGAPLITDNMVKCPICDSAVDKEELGFALEDFCKKYPNTRPYFSQKTVN